MDWFKQIKNLGLFFEEDTFQGRTCFDNRLYSNGFAEVMLTLPPRVSINACNSSLLFVSSPWTDKTPDEVRREFNITEAFSPEVERKLREENKWSTEPPAGH